MAQLVDYDEKRLIDDLLTGFNCRLNRLPVLHEYAKGRYYEPPPESFVWDASLLLQRTNWFPMGDLPERIGNFKLERLDATRYRVSRA